MSELPDVTVLHGMIGARIVHAEFNRRTWTETIDLDNGYRFTVPRDRDRHASYLPIGEAQP